MFSGGLEVGPFQVRLFLDQSNRAERVVADVFVRIPDQVPEGIECGFRRPADRRERVDGRQPHLTVGIAQVC